MAFSVPWWARQPGRNFSELLLNARSRYIQALLDRYRRVPWAAHRATLNFGPPRSSWTVDPLKIQGIAPSRTMFMMEGGEPIVYQYVSMDHMSRYVLAAPTKTTSWALGGAHST